MRNCPAFFSYLTIVLPLVAIAIAFFFTTHTFSSSSLFSMGNAIATIRSKHSASSSSSTSTMSAEQVVTDAIQNNPVVIFSKTYCPFCVSAKSDIKQAGEAVAGFQPPKIFELDNMGSQGAEIQDYLATLTGRRTVPNVFIGGVTVGGGSEVSSYSSSGVLKQMLAQAPTKLAATFPVNSEQEQTESDPEPKKKDDVETFVKNEIANNPVVVFAKSYCPFCKLAKKLLAEQTEDVDGANVVVHELDVMGDQGGNIQDYLLTLSGQRTVPNIFINSKHIGGYDDLSELHEDGNLSPMLSEAYSSVTTQNGSEPEAQIDSETQASSNTREIVFGAGCFWGVELAFQRVDGVQSTEVGYSNGKFAPFTYEAVCTGQTGAAEVVRVQYDENLVSLEQLLDLWQSRHDITSLNKQGNDVGTQYRSAVYYNDDSQKEAIEKWAEQAKLSLKGDAEIVSDIAKVDKYCPAEEYHQRYLEKKGQSAEKGATARIRCYG